MKKDKLKKIDGISGYILLVLSIFGTVLGLLLVCSVLKLMDSVPISSKLFGWILLFISLISLLYAIYLILAVKKKFSKKNEK